MLMYGDAHITKAHPVAAFLAKEKRVKSLGLFKPGQVQLPLRPALGCAACDHWAPAGLMRWEWPSPSCAARLSRPTQQRSALGCKASCEPSFWRHRTHVRRFPSVILPGLLYLGAWDSAEAPERLAELNITRCAAVPVAGAVASN